MWGPRRLAPGLGGSILLGKERGGRQSSPAQPGEQVVHGTSAMAETVLHFKGELGHRLPRAGNDEKRIVTEAVFAAGIGDNFSVADAIAESPLACRACQDHGATEAGGPGSWVLGEPLQQAGAAGGGGPPPPRPGD